jgi:hypothetical protein
MCRHGGKIDAAASCFGKPSCSNLQRASGVTEAYFAMRSCERLEPI